jgi:hypothetical protein
MALTAMLETGYDKKHKDEDGLEVQKEPIETKLGAFLEAQTDIMQEGVWHRLGTDSTDPGCPSAILSARYTTIGDSVNGDPNATQYHLDLLEDMGRLQTSVVISEGRVVATQYTITEGGLLRRAAELGVDDTADALARVAKVVDEGTVGEQIETLRNSRTTIDDKILRAGLELIEYKLTLPEEPYFTHTKIKEARILFDRLKKKRFPPEEHVRDRSTETPLVGRKLGGVAMASSAAS